MKTKDELAKHLRSDPQDGRKRVTETEMFNIFDGPPVRDDVEAWLKANGLDFEIEPADKADKDWFFWRKK